MNIITVIPLTKASFKEELSYFSTKTIPIFSIVSVTLRSKKVLALVIATKNASEIKSDLKKAEFNLKKIIDVKEHAFFSDAFLQSALEMSNYFITKKSSTVSGLIPNVFKEEYDKLAKLKSLTMEKRVLDSNIKSEKLLFQANLEDRLSFYKTLIRGCFAKKESIFLICPTLTHLNFFEEKLSKGIEQFTFSFHSEKGNKNNLDNVKKMLELKHPVLILATPSFLCIMPDSSIIILEAENSNAYKSITQPSVDQRVFVEVFAKKNNKKLILADTLLRFETLARKELEGFSEVRPLSFRTNFLGEIKVIERESKKENSRVFKIFSQSAIEKIKSSLEQRKNIFVFSLRKGLGTLTLCRDCGDTLLCTQCSAPLVLYLSKDKTKRMFICNKCGQEDDPKVTCKNCGSWNLESYGIGTDNCAEELSVLFPQTKILQLDKSVAKNAKSASKIVEVFEKERGAILIGTEMALTYLKQNIDVSIIVSFDSLWSIPHFKMSEKIISIILNIANRTDNFILIQTKNKDDEAVQSFIKDNLFVFARNELRDRESLGYPPYKRFIKINHFCQKSEIEPVKEFLKKYFAGYEIAIYSGFLEKFKDRYSINALIKLDRLNWSLPILYTEAKIDSILHKKITCLPNSFSVNVDPEDLL